MSNFTMNMVHDFFNKFALALLYKQASEDIGFNHVF